MICAYCKNEFTPKPHAHNIKFCSVKCRNKNLYHERGGAEWQREYLSKKQEKDGRPKVQCLICGKWYRQVGTHIVQVHKITAREYREQYGFDVKRGQLPEDYRKLKSITAVENGTAKNLKAGKKFWFKKGQAGVGRYERSEQTKERLKHQFDNSPSHIKHKQKERS